MTAPTPEPGASSQAFMQKLLSPDKAVVGHRELGTTALARQIGLDDDHLTGHWCSRCVGLWYGCALEVECPCCGNRHG